MRHAADHGAGSRGGPRPGGGARALLLAVPLLLPALPSFALVGEGDGEGASPVVSRSYTVLPASRIDAVLRADRAYVTGMRAHHAGALTMSEAYLRDPGASSPMLIGLAHAIIHNQRYEIALLDEVARNLAQPPHLVGLGPFRFAVQPAASEGLAQQYQFSKYPVPGPLTPIFTAVRPVTVRDVQFAKAMTIHHQGALDMAGAYQANPDARNTFLGLLNVDIVTDQTQEIALMRRVVAAYAGDAVAVPVPASMIHGMEGMNHGGHGDHPPGQPAPPAPDPHTGHEAAPSVPRPSPPRSLPGAPAHHHH